MRLTHIEDILLKMQAAVSGCRLIKDVLIMIKHGVFSSFVHENREARMNTDVMMMNTVSLFFV